MRLQLTSRLNEGLRGGQNESKKEKKILDQTERKKRLRVLFAVRLPRSLYQSSMKSNRRLMRSVSSRQKVLLPSPKKEGREEQK